MPRTTITEVEKSVFSFLSCLHIRLPWPSAPRSSPPPIHLTARARYTTEFHYTILLLHAYSCTVYDTRCYRVLFFVVYIGIFNFCFFLPSPPRPTRKKRTWHWRADVVIDREIIFLFLSLYLSPSPGVPCTLVEVHTCNDGLTRTLVNDTFVLPGFQFNHT